MNDIFFNAHHSPIGAFATFTCGHKGAKGGLGLELGRPADENLFIGIESQTEGVLETLPFCQSAEDESKRYLIEQAAATEKPKGPSLIPFASGSITREFHVSTDTWRAGDLTFRILSPVRSVPNPDTASAEELALALVPAVCAELTLDNRQGTRPRRAFFGYQGSSPYSGMRRIEQGKLKGIGQGLRTAIFCADKGVETNQSFTLESCVLPEIKENTAFGLAGVGALVGIVPAGARRTFRFAICFYQGGVATANLATSYYYTRFFKNIEEVGQFALAHFRTYVTWARQADDRIARSSLSDDQKFMMAHAIRSYYGSTELLNLKGKPFWVVNEGEYRMMNTFDLTVDHLFFEMKMNPWVVRNALDLFADRFSYTDKVRFPKDSKEYPGGISFTHDMGVANVLSRPGYSAYELFGLTGCFSHMTHEQLVNWISCATVYYAQTRDETWLRKRLPTLEACLHSLVNRDHPDPARRTGVMKLDSTRTQGGAEITTYDSLDVSLGQSRNNTYLAVKSWAAYVALEKIFASHKKPALAQQAGDQAERCARTVAAHLTPEGYIPAVMDEGCESRIIPAIEGLVFPFFAGCREALNPEGRFAHLLGALKTHLQTVLVPGVCYFADGGWKMSSTSENSWLSKIYLCQFVARRILGVAWDETGAAADAAHVWWLIRPESAYWSWSDQIVSGKAAGSKYYPRGVTSILWLEEAGRGSQDG
jgi:hypothetical protein